MEVDGGSGPCGDGGSRLITVGKVLREWGLRGGVLVCPLTSDPGRFRDLREITLESRWGRERKEVESVSVRKGQVVVSFRGCASPEEARRYRGALIKISPEESPALPEGVYYHYQIEGLEVCTADGEVLGHVAEIMETGSNDVYVVRGGQREQLIPAVAGVIESVDLAAGRIVVRLPETVE